MEGPDANSRKSAAYTFKVIIIRINSLLPEYWPLSPKGAGLVWACHSHTHPPLSFRFIQQAEVPYERSAIKTRSRPSLWRARGLWKQHETDEGRSCGDAERREHLPAPPLSTLRGPGRRGLHKSWLLDSVLLHSHVVERHRCAQGVPGEEPWPWSKISAVPSPAPWLGGAVPGGVLQAAPGSARLTGWTPSDARGRYRSSSLWRCPPGRLTRSLLRPSRRPPRPGGAAGRGCWTPA